MSDKQRTWTKDLTDEMNRVMKQYNVTKYEMTLMLCSAICSALKECEYTSVQAMAFFMGIAKGYEEVSDEIDQGKHK